MLAGKDGFCRNCREKVGISEQQPMLRDNYIENYGGYLGNKSFFGESYGIESDTFPIARKHV